MRIALPPVDTNVNLLQLSFYLAQPQAKYRLQVGVMTNLDDPATFVPVTTINNSTTGVEFVKVSLASYKGNGRYIAFRNTLASGYKGDFSCNYIDDLTLDFIPDPCALYPEDLPYTNNFDIYTASTTPKTGIEPPCWTLAHQYVYMAEEYKPMVYYNPSTAHSGNYSLIINKRGIYAMPPYQGDVNTLQLSFYLTQTQAKYRLQVGVMTDLADPATFEPLVTLNNSGTTPVKRTVSFANYTGTGRYIAFRNILASGYKGDFSCNYIDDINLSLRSAAAEGKAADLPATQHSLALFPNPTTGLLNIEADDEVWRVDVYDYTGRLVATHYGQTTLDLSRLPSGIYTLRIALPHSTEVRRVIKQ